jgi:uncharacterized membrane protein YdjX (TVP38/TMEM64 family)
MDDRQHHDQSTPKPKSGIGRFVPLLVIGAGLAAFFGLGLHRYVSIDTLRDNREALQSFVGANLMLAVLAYMAVYAALVAISFPGAGLLTIFGGFLFGLWGTVPTVIAATIGAVIIFLVAKTALGESLRARAGGFMARFEEGFRQGEFSYLLVLRLVPAFPFWIVNVVPAFLKADLRKYALATLIGIIPGSFVFTSIGAAAGAVFDQGGELRLTGVMTQPEVLLPIAGLIVLSLIPIALKALRPQTPGVSQ